MESKTNGNVYAYLEQIYYYSKLQAQHEFNPYERIKTMTKRPDTMPAEDKKLVEDALNKGYGIEIYDLRIEIDHVNKVVIFEPKLTHPNPSPDASDGGGDE